MKKENSTAITHKQYMAEKAPLILKFSFLCLFSAFILFSLGGCMPENTRNVNTELFKDTGELRDRTSELKRGARKKDVFEALNIPAERFETMNTMQIQTAVYGNSQVQGSLEQLEKFKRKLMSYQGFTLPYRYIESSSSFGFGKVKTTKSGYDLMLILIFEKGRLLKVAIEGTQDLKHKEDKYLWNSLLKTGVKAAF